MDRQRVLAAVPEPEDDGQHHGPQHRGARTGDADEQVHAGIGHAGAEDRDGVGQQPVGRGDVAARTGTATRGRPRRYRPLRSPPRGGCPGPGPGNRIAGLAATVVRILITQNRKVISGTLAATGSGKNPLVWLRITLNSRAGRNPPASRPPASSTTCRTQVEPPCPRDSLQDEISVRVWPVVADDPGPIHCRQRRCRTGRPLGPGAGGTLPVSDREGRTLGIMTELSRARLQPSSPRTEITRSLFGQGRRIAHAHPPTHRRRQAGGGVPGGMHGGWSSRGPAACAPGWSRPR